MFLGKLVFLGLALLPVVAFGLIVKNILFDKDKIMPTIEDLKEAGVVGGGVGLDLFEDGLFDPTNVIYSEIYFDFPDNIFYSTPPHDRDYNN